MKQDAEAKAAVYAGYVEAYMAERGVAAIPMTAATEAIWGTSGRGNPNAVRLIEATATLGFLTIQQAGKRHRLVRRSDKPIPPECYAYAGIEPPLRGAN